MSHLFPLSNTTQNLAINFTTGVRTAFSVLGMNRISDLNFYAIEPAQCVSFYRYDANGDRVENITDWALEKFREHYLPSPPAPLPQEKGARREMREMIITIGSCGGG